MEGIFEPLDKMLHTVDPTLKKEDMICSNDLNHYRRLYINEELIKEKNNLAQLETEIHKKLEAAKHSSLDASEFKVPLTKGQNIADQVAKFGGSWKFIIIFSFIIVIWITINSILYMKFIFDPFPFILLNLILSCLAALQAPIIMMSQNRQEAKDRLHLQHDYQVNLKAELEVRMLHKKIDHLTGDWIRLLEIQAMQLEMLEHINLQFSTNTRKVTSLH